MSLTFLDCDTDYSYVVVLHIWVNMIPIEKKWINMMNIDDKPGVV